MPRTLKAAIESTGEQGIVHPIPRPTSHDRPRQMQTPDGIRCAPHEPPTATMCP